MFIPKIFDGSTNTVAFDPTTLEQVTKKSYYYGNRMAGTRFVIDGYWISKASNTRGALVKGDVVISVLDVEDPAKFTYQDFLDKARVIKDRPDNSQEVRFEADLLIGRSSLWSGISGDEVAHDVIELATAYLALPKTPKGFDGWYALTARA